MLFSLYILFEPPFVPKPPSPCFFGEITIFFYGRDFPTHLIPIVNFGRGFREQKIWAKLCMVGLWLSLSLVYPTYDHGGVFE